MSSPDPSLTNVYRRLLDACGSQAFPASMTGKRVVILDEDGSVLTGVVTDESLSVGDQQEARDSRGAVVAVVRYDPRIELSLVAVQAGSITPPTPQPRPVTPMPRRRIRRIDNHT